MPQNIRDILWQNPKSHIMYDLFRYISLCHYKRHINEAITYKHKQKQHYVQKHFQLYNLFNSLLAWLQLKTSIITTQKDTDDRGSRFTYKYGKHLPNYVASHPGRQGS
jgi:hypothetical protein